MRRVLFLDVDGVLNSHIIAEEWSQRPGHIGYGGWFDETDTATKENVKWGHINVENLREIVETTKCEIVISSAWRKSFSMEKMKEMFAVYGWEDVPIIDKTSVLKDRGLEIDAWLAENPDVTNYVILDDIDQFTVEQQKNFIHTNPECGLLHEDVNKAIEILTGIYETDRVDNKTPVRS